MIKRNGGANGKKDWNENDYLEQQKKMKKKKVPWKKSKDKVHQLLLNWTWYRKWKCPWIWWNWLMIK